MKPTPARERCHHAYEKKHQLKIGYSQAQGL